MFRYLKERIHVKDKNVTTIPMSTKLPKRASYLRTCPKQSCTAHQIDQNWHTIILKKFILTSYFQTDHNNFHLTSGFNTFAIPSLFLTGN